MIKVTKEDNQDEYSIEEEDDVNIPDEDLKCTSTRGEGSLRMFSTYLASAEEGEGEATQPTDSFVTSDILESAKKYERKMGKTQTSMSAVSHMHRPCTSFVTYQTSSKIL